MAFQVGTEICLCMLVCEEREKERDRERERVCTGRTEALFRLKQVRKMALICPCCVCMSTM